ncbi:MAG: hypothetical protein FD138_176 [Planctomycetota bacterium]|nr:MAG: hypothetical protein FD138_176 [Planctomycetota bacterium]
MAVILFLERSDSTAMPSADDRLTNVELLLTHLQHDLEQLSQVVFRQQAELDAVRKELTLLDSRVVTLSEGSETRDPLDEKPPHY